MYVVFILQFKYLRNYLNKAEKKPCFQTMKLWRQSSLHYNVTGKIKLLGNNSDFRDPDCFAFIACKLKSKVPEDFIWSMTV